MNNWWKNSVFYQIYPITFFDSNNDGYGDLVGIIQKLPYLKNLGIDAIWLNPIYKSPFMDGGYDIEDYYAINKKLGTMQDFELLISECKKINIKIVMDLVVGHTSIKHKWFKNSAKPTKNKYSDYYIWTNSDFNGYNGKTIQGMFKRDGGFYVNYYGSQPALNFGFNNIKYSSKDINCDESWKMHYTDERLIPLRNEILDIMRFYLNKGIDGFRVDMANSLVKDCKPSSDNDEDIEGLKWIWNKILPVLRNEYENKMYIAEWVYPKNSVGKCGFDLDFLTHDTPSFNSLYRNEKNLNLMRSFEKGDNFFSGNGKGDIKEFINKTKDLYKNIEGKGYFSSPSGSHDEIRMATKKSNNLIKTIFAFLLTYKHIPFIYYGDEIGITHNYKVSKDGGSFRTGARTPMQWTNDKKRGFTNNKTSYLPVNYIKEQSVEYQINKEDSILNTIKKLIELRKTYSCLNADGEQNYITDNYPLIYERYDDSNKIIIAINPSDLTKSVELKYKKILFENNCEIVNNCIKLKAQSFIIVLN